MILHEVSLCKDHVGEESKVHIYDAIAQGTLLAEGPPYSTYFGQGMPQDVVAEAANERA